MKTDVRYVELIFEMVHLVYNNNTDQYEVWSASDWITATEPWNLPKEERDEYQCLFSGNGWGYSFVSDSDESAGDYVRRNMMGGYFSY